MSFYIAHPDKVNITGEMPESCEKCQLASYKTYSCKLMHRNLSVFDRIGPKPEWCPLMKKEGEEQ